MEPRRSRPPAFRALVAAFSMCVLIPSLAASAPASDNPHIARGLELFEQGLLKAADEQLRLALGVEQSTAADEVRLQILDGMLRAVSADDDLARAAFVRALELDPEVPLPAAATTRVRRVFREAQQEVKARAEGRPPLASQVAKLYAEGQLDGAEALLSDAGARKDLSRAESGQVSVLKKLLNALKGLRSAGPAEAEKAKAAQSAERELKAAEQQLAGAGASMSEAESAQRLVLKGLVLVVKGLVKAESGDEAQARDAFAQALELDPGAEVPPVATARAQKIFDEVKAATPPPPAAQGLPARVARLYEEGKLEQAELLLARSAERTDLTRAESGQLNVLKGLLLVLKGLQKAGPREEDRARAATGAEGALKAVEKQLATTARSSLTEDESAQQLVLKGLVLVVKGLVKAESGNEAQARDAFARALELNPKARVPSLGAPKVQKLFEAAKEATAAPGPAPQGLPEQVAELYADGRLERAELVLAEHGARPDLTRDESAQLGVLKETLRVLKGIQGAGPDEAGRAGAALGAEGPLKAAEERLASGADAPLNEAQARQRKVLGGLFFVIKGLVKAESGDAAQARAAFTQGLELAPGVRLPAVAGPGARRLFEDARASAGARADLAPPLRALHASPLGFLVDGRAGAKRWPGLGLMAGGAALAGGGVVAGIVALSAHREHQRASAAGDWAAYSASRSAGQTASRVADGLYIGSALAVGAGAFLLWRAHEESVQESGAGLPGKPSGPGVGD